MFFLSQCLLLEIISIQRQRVRRGTMETPYFAYKSRSERDKQRSRGNESRASERTRSGPATGCCAEMLNQREWSLGGSWMTRPIGEPGTSDGSAHCESPVALFLVTADHTVRTRTFTERHLVRRPGSVRSPISLCHLARIFRAEVSPGCQTPGYLSLISLEIGRVRESATRQGKKENPRQA